MKKARTEMKALRTVGLIGLGVLLTTIIFFGVGTVLAQGRPGGGMMGGGMMGGNMAEMHAQMHNGGTMTDTMGTMMGGSMLSMHAQMHNGGTMSGMMGDHEMMGPAAMAEMHAQMHNGEAMPAACTAMMADPEMMQHMMAMMHGETPMSIEACQQWMTEQGISPEDQAACLAHMAEHHPAAETTTTP
jgi:hypothetical protein